MFVTIERQIQAARRELAIRHRVYPRQVSAGRMSAGDAADDLLAMRAIVEMLERVRSQGIRGVEISDGPRTGEGGGS
jgi:hypothetical protein